jgi:hypothetical protein
MMGRPHIITQRASGGLVNLVEVSPKGDVIRTLARSLPYRIARDLIRRGEP